MDDLDSVLQVASDRIVEEVMLWSQYPKITFLAHLAVGEQDRVLVDFALDHLERILEHASTQGLMDYSAMLSFANWDTVSDGSPVRPRFLLTHPSQGYYEQLKTRPGISLPARYLAQLVADPHRYEIRETAAPEGEIERVFVRRRDQPEHLTQADQHTASVLTRPGAEF